MSIHMNGLKIFAYHGVLPQENKIGALYIINLNITTDYSLAAETDQLEGTINYASVFALVKEEMSMPSQLLEHVAYRIAKKLFYTFHTITEISISVNKQNPPMGADCNEVGVESVYTR